MSMTVEERRSAAFDTKQQPQRPKEGTMNTDTGRIYEPEEFERRQRNMDSASAYAAVMKQMEDAEAKRKEKAEQREFEKARREGKIVEVSAEVADLVKRGQEAKAREEAES